MVNCGSFSSSPSADSADAAAAVDGGSASEAGATTDGGSPSDAEPTGTGVTLLETRTTQSSVETIVPELPAGLQVGDALVGFWLSSYAVSAVPAGWEQAGSVALGAAGSTEARLWVGAHVVVAADLTASTPPYSFRQAISGGQEFTMINYRGARLVNPVSPAKVVAVSTDVSATPISTLPFATAPGAPSRVLFALASAYDNQPFSPSPPAGCREVARTSGSIVVYQRQVMTPADTNIDPVSSTFQDVGAIGTVALGIVAK